MNIENKTLKKNYSFQILKQKKCQLGEEKNEEKTFRQIAWTIWLIAKIYRELIEGNLVI